MKPNKIGPSAIAVKRSASDLLTAIAEGPDDFNYDTITIQEENKMKKLMKTLAVAGRAMG